MSEVRYRVILYGAGGFLNSNIEYILSLHETTIICIADSNPRLIGTKISGIVVRDIKGIDDDLYDYIVITSNYSYDIAQQLTKYGIPARKIKRFNEYLAYLKREVLEYYPSNRANDNKSTKSIVIVSVDLSFNGATIAAVNMLMVFQRLGYTTALASYEGEKEFIDYLNSIGIDSWVCPNILYEDYSEMKWIGTYDIVAANDYVVHNFVRNYLSHGRILWWLHESDGVYDEEIRFWGKLEEELWARIGCCCVSKEALDSFSKYYPGVNNRIMEYGITDKSKVDGKPICNEKENVLVFALIGFIGPRKGQDILLDAIELMGECSEKCKFIFVGKLLDDEYGKNFVGRVSAFSNTFYYGEIDQIEMTDIYNEADVVISASRSDPLPIVITEAMMYGKLCIIPDCIGTNRYIVPGRDAMVYETGNAMRLAETIRNVIENRKVLEEIGTNSRKVYMKYFSMDAFEKRIRNAFKDTYGVVI